MIRLPEDYNKISIKYTKQVECNWHANKIWIGISLKKNVYRRGYARILTDSARKRIRKDVLANNSKTRINIGHQHDRWMNWRKRWEFKLMLKCHCACTSEFFLWSNIAKRRFILMFWWYILTENSSQLNNCYNSMRRPTLQPSGCLQSSWNKKSIKL